MLVVISDLHLAHRWFNPRKYLYLQRILAPADRVAIVGDFWDSRRGTFGQFVRSRWRHLFPLLKSRKTIYLWGNHDPEESCDDRVNLFSVHQEETVDLQSGTFHLHLEHGRRIAPDPIEEKHPRVL